MLPLHRSRLSNSGASRLGVAALVLAFGAAGACSGTDGGSDPDTTSGRSNISGAAGTSGTAGTQSSEGGASGSGGEGGHESGEGGQSAAGNAGAAGAEADAGSAGEPNGIPRPREYPDVEFVYDPPTLPPLTPDDACALGSTEALPTPLDMYVLFDRSGSMNLPQSMPGPSSATGGGDCNVGDGVFSRWCHSINSLDAFFGSPEATGTGVALQFFPAGDCATSSNPFLHACCSSGGCCQGTAEGTPTVPLQDLPAGRTELASALNAQVPAADRTPIEAALRGLIDHTARARRPDRQMMGLLITDGGPEGCQSSASSLARLVETHRTRTGIPIYVVATQGAAFSWLETIAIAGGAPEHTSHCAGGVRPCHFYGVGAGQPDVFIDVLQQIRRSAIACRFEMPDNQGGLVNPDEIALSVTPSGGDEGVRVNRVAAARDCTSAGGFYYDDNRAPRHILLCPATCSEFRGGDGGKVEVLLGCKGS